MVDGKGPSVGWVSHGGWDGGDAHAARLQTVVVCVAQSPKETRPASLMIVRSLILSNFAPFQCWALSVVRCPGGGLYFYKLLAVGWVFLGGTFTPHFAPRGQISVWDPVQLHKNESIHYSSWPIANRNSLCICQCIYAYVSAYIEYMHASSVTIPSFTFHRHMASSQTMPDGLVSVGDGVDRHPLLGSHWLLASSKRNLPSKCLSLKSRTTARPLRGSQSRRRGSYPARQHAQRHRQPRRMS